MRGKFTALASRSEVVAFPSHHRERRGRRPGGDEAATTKSSPIALVVCCRSSLDAETRARRVVRCAGIPGPEGLAAATADPRAIRNHRRQEPFRTPFHAGQRGIVIFRTFSGRGGREAVRRTETRQWTIDLGRPAARLRLRVVAVRAFRSARSHSGLRHGDGACQRTHAVRSSLGRTIPHAGDPRRRRLVDVAGRRRRRPAAAKAVLDGSVNWQAAPEPKKPRSRKPLTDEYCIFDVWAAPAVGQMPPH